MVTKAFDEELIAEIRWSTLGEEWEDEYFGSDNFYTLIEKNELWSKHAERYYSMYFSHRTPEFTKYYSVSFSRHPDNGITWDSKSGDLVLAEEVLLSQKTETVTRITNTWTSTTSNHSTPLPPGESL